MSGGQIVLLVIVAIVALMVAVGLVAGRRRAPGSPGSAGVDAAGRAAESTEELIASMQKMHFRMHELVAAGRLDEARRVARGLRSLTRRDPDHWVADVAARVNAGQDSMAPDFTRVRTRLVFGGTIEAVEEYRRVTGANHHEAERVVAAMTAAHRLRP